MAEQVSITNGKSKLTVSRKAFDSVYAGKGFSIVGAKAAAAEPATSSKPIVKGGSKKASKKAAGKASKKKATKDQPQDLSGESSSGTKESALADNS